MSKVDKTGYAQWVYLLPERSSMMSLINSMEDFRFDMLIYFLCFVILGRAVQWFLRPKPNAPLLNPRRFFEFSDSRAVSEILYSTRQVLEDWFSKYPTKPMRIIADLGQITILPPSMADEIKNDPRLSFIKASTESAFHITIPGFEPFREGAKNEAALIKNVLHKHLNKTLNHITTPLAEETCLAVQEYFGSDQGWHRVPLRDTLVPLVTRISTRIFLGQDLCRNQEWLRIAASYSSTSAEVANHLRRWPKPLRYLVSLLSPECQNLAKQVRNARALINPILERRRVEEGQEKGTSYNDSLEWFERYAREAYDPAATQLFLSVVSIHTTTDLLCQALEDISSHPEIINPLQHEIRQVLKEEGWNTKALYKMKLLDSVLKESQRLKPVQHATMLRLALEDITLEDGTFIPKGHQISVSCHAMRDNEIYENASSWDGYRYYRQREQSANEHKAQLSSTSPDHMGFGYGIHVCPGRFFAANEVKVIMIYLLLQYEWRTPPGSEPKPLSWCTTWATDPTFELEVRRKGSDDIPVELSHNTLNRESEF
uniref:Trichothecene C-8 hydroxylase cytochrome P450 monooxygenase n=1 Tax=Fusarium sporotrichioides TaxID=5514 RepID=F5AY40_FUSSP|nr:trichothecene C-8 hydroxylase cytochrome P450 monooxygenase [Fusarium sporotrichioides]